MANASSSLTSKLVVTISGFGTVDGRLDPIPVSWRTPGANPNAVDPTASTAITLTCGAVLAKNSAMPAAVPQVETATNTVSSPPRVCCQISGPVLAACAAGFAGDSYWLDHTYPSFAANNCCTRCKRASRKFPSPSALSTQSTTAPSASIDRSLSGCTLGSTTAWNL